MRSFIKDWGLRIAILMVILVALFINYNRSRADAQESVFPKKQSSQRAIPPPYYNTEGKIPGNPEQTIAQMKNVYAAWQTLQKRHPEFKEPFSYSAIHFDARKNPTAYGFSTQQEALKALFRNPDLQYADAYRGNAKKASGVLPFYAVRTRHDGSPFGGPKKPGTRDVLLWTDMYYHENPAPDFRSGKPIGFYLVLWEDGEVQKFDHTEVRYVGSGIGYVTFFPGQAGEPTTGSLTKAEMLAALNAGR